MKYSGKSNVYFRAISANYFFLAVNTVFFLLITPLAIRLMGPEFYGLWVIMLSILLFSTIGNLGMGVVVNKFAAEEGEFAFPHDAIITAGVVILVPIAAAGATLIFALRNRLAAQLVSNPTLEVQLSSALPFIALSLFPQFLSRVPHGYLRSQLRFDLAQMVDTGTNIALWSGAVLIAWKAQNLVWMAAWGFFVHVMSLCAYLIILGRQKVLHWNWEPRALAQMGNFSIFTFLQSLAVSLFQNFDRVVVGFVLGPAAAGVYSVGTSVGLRLSIVVGQVTDVMIPYSSRKASLLQQGRLYEVFHKVSQLINLVLMLSGALLIIWMDTILRYWISPDYSDEYANIFRILIISYLLLSASRPGIQTLIGIGQVRLPALIYLASSVIMLGSLFFASSKWGLLGAASANLVMVILLSSNAFAYYRLQGESFWREVTIGLAELIVLPVVTFGLIVLLELTTVNRLFMTAFILILGAVILWRNVSLRRSICGYYDEKLRRAGHLGRESDSNVL